MNVENIIFDLGNVCVRWDPYSVIQTVLPQRNPQEFYRQMRPSWIELNKGKISEEDLNLLWQQQANITPDQASQLIDQFKTSQAVFPETIELIKKLQCAKIPLYCITDNTKGIIEYHRLHSDFLHYFIDVIVSADLGVLKPDRRIYEHLTQKHSLDPASCVFIDDHLPNVNGAIAVGMQAFQFTEAAAGAQKLMELGVIF